MGEVERFRSFTSHGSFVSGGVGCCPCCRPRSESQIYYVPSLVKEVRLRFVQE